MIAIRLLGHMRFALVLGIMRAPSVVAVGLSLAAALVVAVSTINPTFATGTATAPGALISVRRMPGAPDGASAYGILYTSVGLSGELIPVSGVVIVPKGPTPPGGRPIVSWAHPTTGVVSRCAPSLARVFLASVPCMPGFSRRNTRPTYTWSASQ